MGNIPGLTPNMNPLHLKLDSNLQQVDVEWWLSVSGAPVSTSPAPLSAGLGHTYTPHGKPLLGSRIQHYIYRQLQNICTTFCGLTG